MRRLMSWAAVRLPRRAQAAMPALHARVLGPGRDPGCQALCSRLSMGLMCPVWPNACTAHTPFELRSVSHQKAQIKHHMHSWRSRVHLKWCAFQLSSTQQARDGLHTLVWPDACAWAGCAGGGLACTMAVKEAGTCCSCSCWKSRAQPFTWAAATLLEHTAQPEDSTTALAATIKQVLPQAALQAPAS